MTIELAMRLVFGAILGGVLGWGLTKVKTCAGDTCHVRAKFIYSIIAGAVFGAGVAYYIATK